MLLIGSVLGYLVWEVHLRRKIWGWILNTKTYRSWHFVHGKWFPVFICTTKTKWLNGKHVVFEKVKKGINIMEAMECFGSWKSKTRPPPPKKKSPFPTVNSSDFFFDLWASYPPDHSFCSSGGHPNPICSQYPVISAPTEVLWVPCFPHSPFLPILKYFLVCIALCVIFFSLWSVW